MKYMKENCKTEEEIKMLNIVTVVGRVVEIKDKEIKIEMPRSYKNSDGIYETDIIECMLWKSEDIDLTDLIGVRGRLEKREDKTIVIAEKITLLARKENNRDKEESNE